MRRIAYPALLLALAGIAYPVWPLVVAVLVAGIAAWAAWRWHARVDLRARQGVQR